MGLKIEKKVIPVLVILIGLLGGLYFLLAGDVSKNNRDMSKFEHVFQSLPHPTNTHSLGFEKRFGLLVGNGNHCDFFLGEIRTYNSSKEAVEKYYSAVIFKNPKSGLDEDVEISFIENGAFQRFSLPYDLETLDGWKLKSAFTNQPLYLVYILRQYAANSDPRCH
jgi:hypothetical protein